MIRIASCRGKFYEFHRAGNGGVVFTQRQIIHFDSLDLQAWFHVAQPDSTKAEGVSDPQCSWKNQSNGESRYIMNHYDTLQTSSKHLVRNNCSTCNIYKFVKNILEASRICSIKHPMVAVARAWVASGPAIAASFSSFLKPDNGAREAILVEFE